MIDENAQQGIFDALPQFIAVVGEDGTLLEVNRPGLTFIQASAADVIGKRLWETPWWAHSETLQNKLRTSISRAARGAFVRYQARHPDAGGRERVIDFSIKRIARAGERRALVVEGRDITERQELEDALRLRTEELHMQLAVDHALFDAMAEAGLCLILVENGRIVHANEAIAESLGYSVEEMKAKDSFLDFICAEDRQRVSDLYRRRLAGEPVPRQYDLGLQLRDGSQRQYSASISMIPDTTPSQTLTVLMDIADRKQLEHSLRATASYARNLLESSLDPMLAIDLKGKITDINKATEQITGLPRAALVGNDWTSCLPQTPDIQDALRRVFEDGMVRDFPLFILHVSGRQTEVICNVSLYRDDTGKVQGVLAVARDITDRREYEARLEFQATRDPLTGLPNRLLFRSRLESAVARAMRAYAPIAVVFIDLDNFQDINDTVGHGAGDEVLKEAANRLGGILGPNDTVARIEGDKFAILIDGMAGTGNIESWVRLLQRVMAAPYYTDGQEVTVSCCLGIAMCPDDGKDADSLMRNADTALNRAKDQSTNQCRYFKAEMNHAVQRRVAIGSSLRGALRSGEFTLHYQPRVAVADGTINGLEALIRWNSGRIGPVSPAEFIPVAESNGMIVEIGEWVLRTACRQAAQWHASGIPVTIAVNLSARQLRDTDVTGTVLRALEESGLPPGLLELELTESMLMHDTANVLRTLQALTEIGVALALDDFGTGYSSLGYLKKFPLDYLKIDRSFVNDVPGDANDVAIVRAIIAMSHSLGLKVIAEGVETAAQLDFLRTQGCDQVQGYYFSKPLPAEQLTSLLEAKRLEGAFARMLQRTA